MLGRKSKLKVHQLHCFLSTGSSKHGSLILFVFEWTPIGAIQLLRLLFSGFQLSKALLNKIKQNAFLRRLLGLPLKPRSEGGDADQSFLEWFNVFQMYFGAGAFFNRKVL